jgi:hypothetical protein
MEVDIPYINAEDRERALIAPETAGELNYAITMLVLDYVKTKQSRYQTFNDALGALEGAKLEFYRRVVSPYEEQKRFDNGDVYE